MQWAPQEILHPVCTWSIVVSVKLVEPRGKDNARYRPTDADKGKFKIVIEALHLFFRVGVDTYFE